ncbi:MAG: hypothetical protein PVH93_03060 [Nitrosopumilaceae archaeon]|jgi:hypothetical protein
MDIQTIRRIIIKKAQILIDKKIGNNSRLEQIQLKLAQGLPLLVDNQIYLEKLIHENLTDKEIQSIIQEVDSTKLKKSELSEMSTFHCVCCGNVTSKLDGDGMCTNCYLDYNIKISRFITKPTGRGIF